MNKKQWNTPKEFAAQFTEQSAKAFIWFLQNKLGLDVCRTVVRDDNEIDLSSLTNREMDQSISEFITYYKKCLNQKVTV